MDIFNMIVSHKKTYERWPKTSPPPPDRKKSSDGIIYSLAVLLHDDTHFKSACFTQRVCNDGSPVLRQAKGRDGGGGN